MTEAANTATASSTAWWSAAAWCCTQGQPTASPTATVINESKITDGCSNTMLVGGSG